MKNLMIIGCGGFAGSVLRYIMSGLFQKLAANSHFPLGTLGVNLIGCLFIGLLGGYSDHIGAFAPQTRLFLFIGILGAFTTFSTFGYETVILIRSHDMTAALKNIGIQVILGLFLVWIGYTLTAGK